MFNIGIIYDHKNDIPKATEYYEKCFEKLLSTPYDDIEGKVGEKVERKNP